MNEIHSKIKDILKGIDKRSADDENGWWETNSQEDFGKNILKRINLLFSEVPKQQREEKLQVFESFCVEVNETEIIDSEICEKEYTILESRMKEFLKLIC